MIRLPPRSTPLYSSAASDVYKRQVEELLAAPAAATGADRLTADALDRARNQVAVLAPALDARGDALADRLLADHLRVRATAGGMARRGLTVEPIRPADVLGLYLYLPAVPA